MNNEIVCDEIHAVFLDEFGDNFVMTAGTEGSPLNSDFITRLRQVSERASRRAPAVVYRFTENLLDCLVGLNPAELRRAMEKIRSVVRETWNARLSGPYDSAIRGTEVWVIPSRLV